MTRLMFGFLVTMAVGCAEGPSPPKLNRVTFYSETGTAIKSWTTKDTYLWASGGTEYKFDDAETGRRITVVPGRGSVTLEPEVAK